VSKKKERKIIKGRKVCSSKEKKREKGKEGKDLAYAHLPTVRQCPRS